MVLTVEEFFEVPCSAAWVSDFEAVMGSMTRWKMDAETRQADGWRGRWVRCVGAGPDGACQCGCCS
jgi:hypothetical protein